MHKLILKSILPFRLLDKWQWLARSSSKINGIGELFIAFRVSCLLLDAKFDYTDKTDGCCVMSGRSTFTG